MTSDERKVIRARSGAAEAHTIVARAIRHGELASLSGQACIDCSAPAVHYDHRDYGRPLDVVPTCRACNYKRGPAIWREAA